jgi:hypothetical protein
VRDIGAYAGLCPRRDQSGESDPQLRISKRGDAYLRRLLVSAAQYILGPFGPASALREYGLMLAADGNRRAKKRAVVAFALGALITVVFGYIFILGSLIVGIAHLSGISWTWIAKFFQR